jgi:ATP-binding cassette, subfamily B, multidrug efflux pump
MTRVTNDVETLNELFSSGVVTVFGDLFTLSSSSRDAPAGLAAGAGDLRVLPFVFVAAFVFRGLIREGLLGDPDPAGAHQRLPAGAPHRHAGGAALRPRAGRRRERFERINRDHLEAHLRSITYYALFFPIIEVLTAVAFALILWYGGL